MCLVISSQLSWPKPCARLVWRLCDVHILPSWIPVYMWEKAWACFCAYLSFMHLAPGVCWHVNFITEMFLSSDRQWNKVHPVNSACRTSSPLWSLNVQKVSLIKPQWNSCKRTNLILICFISKLHDPYFPLDRYKNGARHSDTWLKIYNTVMILLQ